MLALNVDGQGSQLKSRRYRRESEPTVDRPLERSEDSALGFVDQRQVGLIRLNRSGEIVDSNGRGSEILRREEGLSEKNGRLWAQRIEDSEALESLLRMVLSGDSDGEGGGPVTVGRWPDPRPLTVYANRGDGRQDDVAAVVLVVDPWCPARLSAEQVAKSFRLTPAESRVAVALAEGRTTREIAEATDRAVPSVRWLVQRVLEKTHCSRQAELVRLVLSSSHLPVPQSG